MMLQAIFILITSTPSLAYHIPNLLASRNIPQIKHTTPLLYHRKSSHLQCVSDPSIYTEATLSPVEFASTSAFKSPLIIDRISSAEFAKQVKVSRLISLLIIGVFATKYHSIEAAMQSIYTNILYSNPFFKHFSFEPLLSSFCFAIYTGIFAIIDHYIPALHKYRIQKSNSNEAWKNRATDVWKNEGLWYLLFWVPYGGIMKARRLPIFAPKLITIIREVISALILYDFFFFIGHFLLHKIPWLYKHIHSKHHAFKIIRAGDSVRHSFLDGMWDVICAVASLNLLGAHCISRSVFNIIAIYLIVEAHSNYNFPMMLSNLVPADLIAGPIPHTVHHQTGWGNFQKFFTYFDRFFGFASLTGGSDLQKGLLH